MIIYDSTYKTRKPIKHNFAAAAADIATAVLRDLYADVATISLTTIATTNIEFQNKIELHPFWQHTHICMYVHIYIYIYYITSLSLSIYIYIYIYISSRSLSRP